MPKRGRPLMPPHWPPASFSGALGDESATHEQTHDTAPDAHDPLARLDAVTASPAWNPPPHAIVDTRMTTDARAATLSPDAYRSELEQIGREIENLRLLLLQVEREIETQSQRQELAQSEVAKIENRLQQHSHEEIRAAYAHASETEMRAFMASEQRDQMIAKLQAFERYERFLRGAIEALDAAEFTAPTPQHDVPVAHNWRRTTPEPPLSNYLEEVDDDYETMWMTPTSPIPAIRLTTPMEAVNAYSITEAVSEEAASPLHDFPSAHAVSEDADFNAQQFASTEAERPEPAIPLPRPQLPEEHSPWITEEPQAYQPTDDSAPTPNASQHVVIMGPRTASLTFRGEENGQWQGAHAVLHRVVQAQEEVAERVARQIQDVALQALTQLAVEADYFEHQAATNPKAALEGLQQVRAHLNAALQEANNALLSIQPMGDGRTSLIGALRRYAMSITTQYNLPFELQTPDREVPLSPETVKLAFRVAQEAMLNAARHAHASLLLISVAHTSDTLRVIVEDDGVGFDAEQEVNRAIRRSGGGLLGMLERAELLGGHLRIDSMPSSGCNVELLVPLPHR